MVASNEKKDRDDSDLDYLEEQRKKEVVWTRDCAQIFTYKLNDFVQGKKGLDDLLQFMAGAQDEIKNAQKVLRLQEVMSLKTTQERIEFIKSNS